MDIIGLAFRLVARVETFAERARRLYYAVMLMGHSCPQCAGRLVMLGEGRCRCKSCGHTLDPTLAFQRCPNCGDRLRLVVRRYRCKSCSMEVTSRFLFDGLVFDAEYFREKMAESRRRKRELRDQVREMLAASRSHVLLPEACDLRGVPGLAEALDCMVASTNEALHWRPKEGFDLKRYQRHLRAHIRAFPLGLGEIPALGEDARKDLIWRFIAAVFMAHAGLIRVWQDGQTIMVMQRETDREGQDVSGDLEAVDGIQGSLGRAQA